MSIDLFEFDYGKWLIRLSTEYDPYTLSPFTEYGTDAFSEAQEKAWKADEWCWVSLKAEAILEGITLGEAVLGSVQSGFIPDEEGNPGKFLQSVGTAMPYVTGYYDPTTDLVNYHDLVDEAVTEAVATLAKLVAAAEADAVRATRDEMPAKPCKPCAARGIFTWLNSDGTCRRADRH